MRRFERKEPGHLSRLRWQVRGSRANGSNGQTKGSLRRPSDGISALTRNSHHHTSTAVSEELKLSQACIPLSFSSGERDALIAP